MRIGVRIRTDAGWSDATVHNLSARGMMLMSAYPLRRNEFVEIARGERRVVGRIIWSDAASCGLYTQDPIDIDGLLSKPGAAGHGGDRRRAGRRTAVPATARTTREQADHARLIGRGLERAGLIIAAATFAALVAPAALDSLSRPFAEVQAALTTA